MTSRQAGMSRNLNTEDLKHIIHKLDVEERPMRLSLTLVYVSIAHGVYARLLKIILT